MKYQLILCLAIIACSQVISDKIDDTDPLTNSPDVFNVPDNSEDQLKEYECSENCVSCRTSVDCVTCDKGYELVSVMEILNSPDGYSLSTECQIATPETEIDPVIPDQEYPIDPTPEEEQPEESEENYPEIPNCIVQYEEYCVQCIIGYQLVQGECARIYYNDNACPPGCEKCIRSEYHPDQMVCLNCTNEDEALAYDEFDYMNQEGKICTKGKSKLMKIRWRLFRVKRKAGILFLILCIMMCCCCRQRSQIRNLKRQLRNRNENVTNGWLIGQPINSLPSPPLQTNQPLLFSRPVNDPQSAALQPIQGIIVQV